MSEVAGRLSAILDRIAAAEARANRPSGSVQLVGAAKIQPVEALRAAYDAGLRQFGENRVQEGIAKAPALPDDIEWHLLGPLQSNKVRKALGLFTLFHAIDRPKIALALDTEAGSRGIQVRGLLEVNLGGEATKHGFDAELIGEQAESLAHLEHLRIVGLMSIPPPTENSEAARADFGRLRRLRDTLDTRPEWSGRLVELSMGMSDDYEIAVEEGATFVRIGSSLFGTRPT